MATVIKICGVNHPTAIEACCKHGVDAVGVVFDRGPCKVALKEAKELIQHSQGANIQRIAVVGKIFPQVDAALNVEAEGKTSYTKLQKILELGFDMIQAWVTPDLWHCPILKNTQIIPAFVDGPSLKTEIDIGLDMFAQAKMRLWMDLINVDSPGGGATGRQANWDRISKISSDGLGVILSGGLRSHNVATALQLVRPRGVDVSSGVELTRGVKDPQLISEFVGAVREWEKRYRDEQRAFAAD